MAGKKLNKYEQLALMHVEAKAVVPKYPTISKEENPAGQQMIILPKGYGIGIQDGSDFADYIKNVRGNKIIKTS